MTADSVTSIRERLATIAARRAFLLDPAKTRGAGMTDEAATGEIVALSIERADLLDAWDALDTETDPDDEPCRTCGEAYSHYGDGYDGECPSCADASAIADGSVA